ncbi:SulP family inorganic anion transporter [Roseibium sp. M-1]
MINNLIGAIVGTINHTFRPRPWIKDLSRDQLKKDAYAGLTGATIVLPQGVAFAAIAGLPPQYGFYSAMVPTVIAALFGSSMHTVSGPTTAISVLVFGALSTSLVPGSPAFIQGAIWLALLVGIVQLLMGIARLGVLVDFISHSVMLGFVSGAALLIGLSQIRLATGLDLPRSEHLLEFLSALWHGLAGFDPISVTISGVALFVGAIVRIFKPLWPNYMIAICAASGLYVLLGSHAQSVVTIDAPNAVFSTFDTPIPSMDFIQNHASAAVAIAIVGLLEAISVGRALALRSGSTLDGNREFTGQGLSNIGGSFFQSYPSSASFTRSGANFDAGAQTPMAAVFSALFLALILLVASPWLSYVPIPAMAGVILLVAWNLLDRRELARVFTTSLTETSIAVTTFLAALLIDLESSIYIGVLLSFGLFLKKTAHPFVGVGAPDNSTPNRTFRPVSLHELPECPQILISRLDGPLYFGSVEFIRREFRRFESERRDQKHMLLVLFGIGHIDLPGCQLLIEEARRRRERGGSLSIYTKTPCTIATLKRFHVDKEVHCGKVFQSKGDAIAEIIPLVDGGICQNCCARVFLECATQPGFELQ